MNGCFTTHHGGRFGPSIAALLVSLPLLLAGCKTADSDSPETSRDHLLGWYQRAGGDAVIPVFKQNGNYYSVCHGFEIPLKECPEGLEWAARPSSMAGTRIGCEAATGAPYLAVLDSQASNFTDGRYGVGEREPLKRIAPPPGLRAATARRPRRLADFVGCFQPVWTPGLCIEIRCNGDRYLSDTLAMGKAGGWEKLGESNVLKPLPDQSGFTGFERKGRQQLIYNQDLKRFEMVISDGNRNPSVLRMPLAKATISSNDKSAPVAKVRIGIPSWR